MIAYKYRFHGHNSVRFVSRNGTSVHSGAITLKYLANLKRKQHRIAVVVSKKVLKSAVGRNRIRRRVYEIMRQLLPELRPTTDIVLFITQANVKTMPSEELHASIKTLCVEAGIYNNKQKNDKLNTVNVDVQ